MLLYWCIKQQDLLVGLIIFIYFEEVMNLNHIFQDLCNSYNTIGNLYFY